MNISDNLSSIKKDIPSDVTLVAVSKFKSNDDILEAYAAGQRVFGENYVQELVAKYSSLPHDIEWHFIGHLQRNKVKFIAPFVHIIHGVDSLRLLEEINKQGKTLGKVINCLLQMHIATEDNKEGLNEKELADVLVNLDKYENVAINGLMGMASFTENVAQIKGEFESLKKHFENLKLKEKPNFRMQTLSMGMSGDFKLAIETGSNMIRVGTLIFGNRK
jgi:PLP dependent protein